MVGIGSDGAACNIAQSGLRGLVESQLDWIFWMWCLAHHLELVVKDVLKGPIFDAVDDSFIHSAPKIHSFASFMHSKCQYM